MTNAFNGHYDKLNQEQRVAVDTMDGALLVLAGPGTGKTQLLSVRTANLIRNAKARPAEILILTFSNSAASTMRDRLARIIGHEGYSVEVETFHSFANSIILESEGALKYIKDKIEISEIEKIRAFEYIMDNVKGVEPLRPFGVPYIHRSEIEKRISELKNEGISPCEFMNGLEGLRPDGINLEEKNISRLKALAVIYDYYEKLKNEKSSVLFDERGRIDYDDMILVALDALKRDDELRGFVRKQYKYVMVDEFQDTNGAQLELLFGVLDPRSPNICCVGDDDQSIYRFQGATLANFHTLKKKVPAIKVVDLRINYRSTDTIVGFVDGIIGQLAEKERFSVKKLIASHGGNSAIRFLEFRRSEEEMAFITNEINRQAGIIRLDASLSAEERQNPFNNIAVLVRKRAQILRLIDAFLRAGIPYATDGGEDIRPEKRVREMLDVLEIANVDTEGNSAKALALYKILASDYADTCHADILKFIEFVNNKKTHVSAGAREDRPPVTLLQEFQVCFPVDPDRMPSLAESRALDITRSLDLKNPNAIHRMAWAINRLILDARDKPVHDILMQYIEDTGLYRYILKRYEHEEVLRMRDLRALVSFINMVKESNMSNPSIGLDEFMDEFALREIHSIPLRGEIATESQDGVRLYTAHASKGLEFHTVFLPFCLQTESWPIRRKGDTVPLAPDIYPAKERVSEKDTLKKLNLYDELRLFYVASTRAKVNLIYTATPSGKTVSSQFLAHMGIKPENASPDNESSFLADFFKKTKKRDPFEDAEGILRDIVTNMTLNPTSLNNYIACRRKFLYDNVLRLPGKKNQNLVFGNCAHAALEETYRLFMSRKKFPPFSFFEKAFKRALEFQGMNNAIKKACLAKLATLEGWYRRKSAAPVMPMDLENKLEVRIHGGPVFRGTFDKIEEEPDGTIRVVDYKTGKPDKHIKAIANCVDLSKYECDGYYRQLIAYKILYEASRPRKEKRLVSTGVLEFLEPVTESVRKYNMETGVYQNVRVKLTDAMVEELTKLIIGCWGGIQSLNFDKLPERDDNERCRRCDYDSICWG